MEFQVLWLLVSLLELSVSASHLYPFQAPDTNKPKRFSRVPGSATFISTSPPIQQAVSFQDETKEPCLHLGYD
jgi:hypothetical protein